MQQLNSSTLPASLLRFQVTTVKWFKQSLQLYFLVGSKRQREVKQNER